MYTYLETPYFSLILHASAPKRSVPCILPADGLVDCEDPDCCSALDCGDSQYCKASPDPRDILLRKQPPSTTASFYEKMRFLIEENSVQTYATRNSFNERCVLQSLHAEVDLEGSEGRKAQHVQTGVTWPGKASRNVE